MLIRLKIRVNPLFLSRGQGSLTFRHWADFSPYTSSFRSLQRPVFLVNSRQAVFCCSPPRAPREEIRISKPEIRNKSQFFKSARGRIEFVSNFIIRASNFLVRSTRQAGHLANLRPAFLPSSLNLFLSLALVYSTCPPVLVLGTVFACSCRDNFLGSQNHPTLFSFWEKRPSWLGLKQANGFSY